MHRLNQRPWVKQSLVHRDILHPWLRWWQESKEIFSIGITSKINWFFLKVDWSGYALSDRYTGNFELYILSVIRCSHWAKLAVLLAAQLQNQELIVEYLNGCLEFFDELECACCSISDVRVEGVLFYRLPKTFWVDVRSHCEFLLTHTMRPL